jgi:ATP-dependent Clp protease ATP-binding subunit ClpA
MFERFTHAARQVVIRAQEEARELHHSTIGTQHLLLALVADETGAVARTLEAYGVDRVRVRDAILRATGSTVADTDPLPDADAEDKAALKAIGIDLDQVRRTIEENFGPGALHLSHRAEPKRRGLLRRFSGGGGGHIPFSPRAKKVLELSLREALRLKHNFIAPEHVMLGLLREGQGLAAQILAEYGVDQPKLRADLTRSLDEAA